ncbi:MAG: amidase [Alphaproteobacteria bacterium]
MTSSDLAYLGLAELGQAIKARKVSPVEATRATLDRIGKLDGKLHSYVTLMAESAEREARAAEEAIGKGDYRGPLHGVPVGIKDLCDAAGVATMAGMPRINGKNIASKDSTVVARLRAAGAVVLGKLELTEGAVAHHHPDVKPPVNPHNADYWSGASSSGSGVATAAGLCYGSLGSDTGGSIRFPSFANGVTGIKPSWGRVSRARVAKLAPSLDHVGPMTRSAADAGAVLGAIAGADPDDPTTLRAPVPDYLAEVGKSVKGLRVGFDEAYASTNVDPLIVQAVRDAVALFKNAGAEIRPIKFPNTAAVVQAWFPICGAEAAVVHEKTYPSRKAEFGPGLSDMADAGHKTSGMDYAKAHEVRLIFRGQLDVLFEEVDIVVSPAWMRQNLTNKEFDVFGEKETDWPELIRFTSPLDIGGVPTISLPAGFNKDGAPYGFQLIARHLNEPVLVRAGDAYQRETDWHKRRPKLAP